MRRAEPQIEHASLPVSHPAAEDLRAAFSRFSESSKILEERYQTLRTETEFLRARLKQKDEEIAQHARLSMLGETAAALAHEVRNPLGALRLFLSLLKEEVGSQPQSQELIAHMDRTITSLNHVVENVLQFAKDNRVAFAPLNINALLCEQCAILTSYPSAQLEVIKKLTASPFVRGNEHALRQVFANLLTNAAEAMQWRGTILLSTRDIEDKVLEVSISDSGPGIDTKILPHLFEPFVTGKQEGTGLGLAVVKRILTQHSATISIANAEPPAHGALVQVRLVRDATTKVKQIFDENHREEA